jgi:hypothetical protein
MSFLIQCNQFKNKNTVAEIGGGDGLHGGSEAAYWVLTEKMKSERGKKDERRLTEKKRNSEMLILIFKFQPLIFSWPRVTNL